MPCDTSWNEWNFGIWAELYVVINAVVVVGNVVYVGYGLLSCFAHISVVGEDGEEVE